MYGQMRLNNINIVCLFICLFVCLLHAKQSNIKQLSVGRADQK